MWSLKCPGLLTKLVCNLVMLCYVCVCTNNDMYSQPLVPPNESMYSFFDPDRGSIEILIMHGNPNPIEEHRAINYNTTAPGMRADRISKSAKVGLYCKIAHYSCSSVGKNVLLKYHGDGVIKPRSGVRDSSIYIDMPLTNCVFFVPLSPEFHRSHRIFLSLTG